jgi:hypothetical protein
VAVGVGHGSREIEAFEFHRPRRPAAADRRGAGVMVEDR